MTILVKIDQPSGDSNLGGVVAAPVFALIAADIMEYLNVPTTEPQVRAPWTTLVLDTAFVEQALGSSLRARSGPAAQFRRAVIDSRRVERVARGDLFVALPGEHHDGHAFAAEAVAHGASGLLLGRAPSDDGAAAGAAVFVVDDPLAALQRLAAAWRAALPATEVVGVTGNVGKTTTKLIAAAVLARRYRVQASELNYNNEIGVPLCLLELQPETERAVIEHGMYTTGEIALLCEWDAPARRRRAQRRAGAPRTRGLARDNRAREARARRGAAARGPRAAPCR